MLRVPLGYTQLFALMLKAALSAIEISGEGNEPLRASVFQQELIMEAQTGSENRPEAR